ncbi:hypothetical protein ACIBVK_26445 [Micromonospora echinofusca]|uniref:hypothetical protein n=1 Tax=Micromonospora echinofusca TaxID=47858 RepID=UPI0037AEBCDE
MTQPEWRIRTAQARDRDLLASFICADPVVNWQVEVEQFIRKHLLDGWALAPGAVDDDPRLLLAFTATGELFGVAAHERQFLQGGSGVRFAATKLEVAAVSKPWQGRRFGSGARASDVLMSAVMTDVASRVPPRDARVFAIIHEDNHRSLALCRRHGLVQEMTRPHPEYRRLVTAHRASLQRKTPSGSAD